MDFTIFWAFFVGQRLSKVIIFIELEHYCGHSKGSEKIHQVILAIRECKEIDFTIFGAFFCWSEVVGVHIFLLN